jgi:peptidyl-prolyl cis-trans isomerase SurA
MKIANFLVRSGVLWIGPAVLLPLLGCGQKVPQGKYTEEQMLDIPLANRYDLPDPTGGMVFSIGTQTLTADEVLSIPQMQEALAPLAGRGDLSVYEPQAMSWMRSVIRSKVGDMLLYEEARKKAPDNVEDMLDTAVKKEIERFVADYDNNLALAEAELKRMGMDWKSFEDLQRKMIMTQTYISSTMTEEKKFTRAELLDYYNQIKGQFSRPGRVQFQLIEIMPDQLKAEQIKEGESRQQAAARLADEILGNLYAGQDFGELARQYSHGPLANVGGLWAPVTLGADSLAEPYDLLEAHAQEMTAGSIKGPIDAGDRLFILRVRSITPAVSRTFEEVEPMLRSQMEIRYKNQKYNEMVEKVIQRADLVEMERFAEFCAREGYRRWSQTQG